MRQPKSRGAAVRWIGAFVGILVVAAVSPSGSASADAYTYNFTILPIPLGVSAIPLSINDSGQIVGAEFGTYPNFNSGEAFLYSGGNFTTFGVPGASATFATGINNSGEITGTFVSSTGAYSGFLYTNNNFTVINIPSAVRFTEATGINNNGQVVGTFFNGTTDLGFLFTSGSFTTIQAPGATNTNLIGINNEGQILGLSDGQSYFIDNAGTFTPLNLNTPSWAVATPTAINDAGQIAGTFYGSNGYQGFVQTGLNVTTVNAPSVCPAYAEAAPCTQIGDNFAGLVGGLNDAGQVVGFTRAYVNPSNPVPQGFIATLVPVVSPTPLTLAKLSADVYDTSRVGANGYTPMPAYYRTDLASGFSAQAYQDGNQIVIAVRGTTLDQGLTTAWLNLVADGSFPTKKAFGYLVQDVGELNNLVAAIEKQYPGDYITLTGHSLGGALAQIVGYYDGIGAMTFNAPGAYGILSQFYSDFGHLPVGGPGITDYRLYGDQISLVGQQIGSSITISDAISNSAVDESLQENPMTFEDYHNIQNVIGQLSKGAPQVADSPAAVNLVGSFTPSTAAALSAGAKSYAEGLLCSAVPTLCIVVVLGSGANFAAPVNDGTQYWLDPGPGRDYLLQENAGSPFIESINLPEFGGIAGWQLEYHDANGWSLPEIEMSNMNSIFDFNMNVDAVNFMPLDASGIDMYNPYSFVYGITFDSSGQFAATEFDFGQVPEPGSLALMASGLVGLAFFYRRKRLS